MVVFTVVELWYEERVAISNRLRANFYPSGVTQEDQEEFDAFAAVLEPYLVTEEEWANLRIVKETFQKLIQANGLDHMKWDLKVVNAPG